MKRNKSSSRLNFNKLQKINNSSQITKFFSQRSDGGNSPVSQISEKIPEEEPIGDCNGNSSTEPIVKTEESSSDVNDILKDINKIKIKRDPSEKSVISRFFDKKASKMNDSIDDFQVKAPVKRPPALKQHKPSKRSKKQPDIRKVLKINPNLVYKEEALFSRMIAKKSAENQMDGDEIQLAVALSRSMTEQTMAEVEIMEEGLSNKKTEPKRKTTNASTNKKTLNVYDLLGLKVPTKRKFNKSSLLTRRDPEQQNQMVANRVEQFLEENLKEFVDNFQDQDPFFLLSSYLFDMRVRPRDHKLLQLQSNDQNTEHILDEFYIKNLIETSRLKSGYLLRNWRKIPGRSPSPEPVNPKIITEDKDEQELEKEIEEINKQSNAFLETFEWKTKSPSPDLFATSSLSINNSTDNMNSSVKSNESSKLDSSLKMAATLNSDSNRSNNKETSLFHQYPDQVLCDLGTEGISNKIKDPEDQHVDDSIDEIDLTQDSPKPESRNSPKPSTSKEDWENNDSNIDMDSIAETLERAKQLLKEMEGVKEIQGEKRKWSESPILLCSDEETTNLNAEYSQNQSTKYHYDNHETDPLPGTSKGSFTNSQTNFKDVSEILSSDEETTNLRKGNSQISSTKYNYENLEKGPLPGTSRESLNNSQTNLKDVSEIVSSDDETATLKKDNGQSSSSRYYYDNLETDPLPGTSKDGLKGSQTNFRKVSEILSSDEETTNKEEYGLSYSTEYHYDNFETDVLPGTSKDSLKNSQTNLKDDLEIVLCSDEEETDFKEDDINNFLNEYDSRDNERDQISGTSRSSFKASQTSLEDIVEISSNSSDSQSENVELDKEIKFINSPKSQDVEIPVKESNDEIKTPKTPKSKLKPRFKQDQLIIKTRSVTPPPDYSNMSQTQIERELFKYGLKNLKGKKAIRILEHIYNQLHPEIECREQELDSLGKDFNETIQNLENQLGIERIEIDEEIVEQPFKEARVRQSKKVTTCALPIEIAFKNRLQFNPVFHEQILQYKPIDLDELQTFFKSINLKYNVNDIIAYLDLQCITYRTMDQRTQKKPKS